MPARQDPAAPLFAWKPFLAALFTLALGLVVVAAMEWSYQRTQTTLSAMKVQDDSRLAAETVLRRLVDAENAQQVVLLTAEQQQLAPFNQATQDVAAALQRLKSLQEQTAGSADQVAALDRAVEAKLAELQLGLRWHRDGQEDLWRELLSNPESPARMQAVRQTVGTLIEEATVTGDQEHATVQRTLSLGRQAVHLTTLMAAVWLVFFLRNNAALQRSQREHAQAIAQERDHLDTLVRQRTRELAQLNLHLQTLREGERGLLARSLHDELGAVLTAAKLDVTRLRRSPDPQPQAWHERLQHLAESIDEGIAIKRRVIEDLMPSALHNLGLRPALEILVNQFRRDTEVDTHLSVSDIEANEASRNAVFQVVQESLRNVSRYARASTVQVIVSASADMAEVTVRDDGVGYELQQLGPDAEGSGRGLSRLRYRVELSGGRFAVFSAPGRGTEVRASVPLTWAPDATPADHHTRT